MRQLLLNLEAPKPPTLASFVSGRNAEVAALLTALESAHVSATALDLGQRFIYLWGERAAGKSHLLQALAAAPDSRLIVAATLPEESVEATFAFDATVRLYLIDDCDCLTPTAQIAAFALFNQVRDNGGAMVASGALPPANLVLREDLRTRLGWGLIYHLHELTDEEKIDALCRNAEQRSLRLSPGVLPYLMTHFQRDMRSLSAMLDALDRYSLETQRPITLPLLRSLLQLEGEPPA